MEINLSNDDLKIIGCVITWTLYTPFSRSTPPPLSEHEHHRLQLIFDAICRCRQEVGISCEAMINETGLIVQGRSLTSHMKEVRDIIACVDSFRKGIGHSPDEVVAVTGLPNSQLDSLVERLSKLKRGEGA